MKTIKVLTLREPWASLMGEGVKYTETRSWCTKYRGELYIHAGAAPVPKNDSQIQLLNQFVTGDLHYGLIFLKATLIDCVQITKEFAEKEKSKDLANYLCGDYSVGRYAWILSNIEPIPPVSAKGRLGIWNFKIDCPE